MWPAREWRKNKQGRNFALIGSPPTMDRGVIRRVDCVGSHQICDLVLMTSERPTMQQNLMPDKPQLR